MSSSGRLGLLLAIGLGVPGPAPAVPPALATRVAAAVAGVWVVDTASLRLEWGAVQHAEDLSASTPFRLVGRGSDGWFAVVFSPDAAHPSAARLHAGIVDSVLVMARALGAGDTLAADAVRGEERVRWGMPARVQRQSPAIGWIARRPLAVGDLVTASTVEPPPAVHAGQTVRLEWVRGDVIVALDGTALNDAALGEPVHARIAGRTGQRSGVAGTNGTVRMDP
jgi:flagella basal body P-ring formation protein FlgA